MDCYTKYEMYIPYAKYIFERFTSVNDSNTEENDEISQSHQIQVLIWKDNDAKTLERVLSSGQVHTTLKSLDLAEQYMKNLRFKHYTYDGDVIYIACFNSGYPNEQGKAKAAKNMYVFAYNESGHLSNCDPIFPDLSDLNRLGTPGRYVNLDRHIWADVGENTYLSELRNKFQKINFKRYIKDQSLFTLKAVYIDSKNRHIWMRNHLKQKIVKELIIISVIDSRTGAEMFTNKEELDEFRYEFDWQDLYTVYDLDENSDLQGIVTGSMYVGNIVEGDDSTSIDIYVENDYQKSVVYAVKNTIDIYKKGHSGKSPSTKDFAKYYETNYNKLLSGLRKQQKGEKEEEKKVEKVKKYTIDDFELDIEQEMYED